MNRRMIISLLMFVFCCSLVLRGQELNGQMGYEGPRQSTRINADADKSIIHVTSRIPNLRFDSNRGILKVVNLSSGDWDVLVSPGTHILKIAADNYEQLVLPPFNFQKLKLYEMRISPKVLPQKFGASLGKGSLFVDTDPTGSKLVLPDMEGEWITPKQFKSIKAGIWTLVFTRDKYDTLIAEILVNKDSTVQPPPFKLVPTFGTINVRSNVEAQIFIDGIPAAISQNNQIEVRRGSHEIVFRKNRYEDYREVVDVGPGWTILVNANLKPKFGTVEFIGFEGANVWLDSQPIRVLTPVETDTGQHTVRVNHSRIGDRNKSFSVAAGQNTIVRFSEFEESGVLNISTDVLADISIDGKLVGKTMVTQTVSPGTHTIDLVHPRLGRLSEEAAIYPGQRANLFLSMLPSRGSSLWLSLLPGASQIYKKQTFRGYLYAGVFAVSAGATVYFLSDYTKKNDEYTAAVNGYNNATTNADAALYRQKITTLYDGVNTASKMRNNALIATGALYLWNIIDALVFSPEYGYRGEGKSNVTVGFQTKGDAVKVELSMGF